MMTRVRAQGIHLLEHNEEPVLLSSVEDVDVFVDSVLMGSGMENLAAIYSLERSLLPVGVPDHELLIGLDRARGVGIVRYMDERGAYVSYGGPSTKREVFYMMQGHHTEFSDYSEVPIELVRQAAMEFFSSRGDRPVAVEWQ